MPSQVANNPVDVQPEAPRTPGIIGGQIASSPVSNAVANAEYNPTSGMQVQTYTPQTREVNRATETTQGQLESILAGDSPLMQRARTLATQQMNARGLVNSSMNTGAGVAAMVDRAAPIAQSDAATYDTRTRTNMDAVNTAGQFNVGQNNQLVGQGLSIAAQMAAQKDQQTFQSGETALDRAQQDRVLAAQQTFQAGETALERAHQDRTLGAQQTFQSAQAELERAQQTFLADKSAASQAALQQAQQVFAGAQADLERAQQMTLAERDLAARQQSQASEQDFKAVQAGLDRESAEKLANLQLAANSMNAGKDFAAQTSSQTLAAINAIQTDPKLKPDAKRAAIQNIIDTANSTLRWGATFYNTDIPAVAAPSGNHAIDDGRDRRGW